MSNGNDNDGFTRVELLFDAQDRPTTSEPIGPPDQPFQLIKRLGRGGMGEVCLARDLEEERILGGERLKALKLVRQEIQFQDPRAQVFLEREAYRAARLHHPNVVNVQGLRRDLRRGITFIVMEYLPGVTLEDHLANQGKPGFPLEQVLGWMRQIAAGVEHAHAVGLIHRDLKPGNLMLLDGVVKVLDFGVAYQLRRAASTVHIGHQPSAGTPQYMSPEMHQRDVPAHETQDIYALSCITYELLTGERPFSAEASKRRKDQRELPPQGKLSAAVHQALCRGFAAEAAQRPQTVRAWLQTLEAAASAPRRRRQRWAALCLAGALLAGGAWWWSRVDVQIAVPVLAPVPESEALATLRTELAAANTAREAAESRRATLAAQLEALRQAREQAGGEAAAQQQALTAQLAQVQRELEAAQQASVASAQEVERLTVALATSEAQVATLSDQVAALEAQLEALQPPAPPTGVFRDTLAACPNLAPEMVPIPAGSFMMGSPEDETGRYSNERQHRVTISEPFALSKYEVTFELYDCFARATDKEPPPDRGWGRGDRPVINVSWYDAVDFTAWLSQQTGEDYRLPTEAEWEYAARAGSTTAYPWGDAVGQGRANCDGCGSRWDGRQTAPVGSFAANGFGLHDMIGNVWEWTCSVYDANYGGAEQQACDSNNRADSPRVLRGGSWSLNPRWVRSAGRFYGAPGYRYNVGGVRLARSL